MPRALSATGPHDARPMVMPFARALSLLAAFAPQDRWLGTGELSARTALPPSTVTRLAQSLVLLGYLMHSAPRRAYRLAAPVLGLGYGAIANSDVQRTARTPMERFAQEHRVPVSLSSRDRLDVVVLDRCESPQPHLALTLHVGARLGMASSPIGWALLAALPELERYYLLEHVERRSQRDWPRLRRRCNEGIVQVQERGFCHSIGESDREIAIVAAPILVQGDAPVVVACVGAGDQATRARVDRVLGPSLLALAMSVQEGMVPA